MSTQYVRIYYGPYDAFHTVSHKPQKLAGVRDHLRKLGFRVHLVPVQFINYCVFEMCGHEVFRCNIKNLQFNMPLEEDSVCERAVQAVVEASSRFSRARLYLWFWSLIEDQLFRRSEFTPKDFWPFDVENTDVCLVCTSCCGIQNTDS